MRLIGDSSGERLDVFAARTLGITRACAQRLLREAGLKPSSRVQEGRACDLPDFEPTTDSIEPEPVEFAVLHEDADIVVLNKPAGLVVHPAPGHWRGTLVHGLIFRYPEMRKLNRLRPGIVQRLDATTSGLMVAARTATATEALRRQFQDRRVTKEYLALAHGKAARREGTLSGPIARDPSNPLKMAVVEGGKPALTGYEVLWSRGGVSLIRCRLYTGRTHQIRVHLAALGHPLVGDVVYGGEAEPLSRVYLHSWKLSFHHPATGRSLFFRLPLPEDFRAKIGGLIS